MDSKLDGLNLPVLKPEGPRAAELEGPDPPYRVASVMEHYFEWIGTFQFSTSAGITRLRKYQFICSCDEEETLPFSRYMLRLRDTVGVGAEEVELKWRRMNGKDRPFSDRPGAVFVFGDDDASPSDRSLYP